MLGILKTTTSETGGCQSRKEKLSEEVRKQHGGTKKEEEEEEESMLRSQTVQELLLLSTAEGLEMDQEDRTKVLLEKLKALEQTSSCLLLTAGSWALLQVTLDELHTQGFMRKTSPKRRRGGFVHECLAADLHEEDPPP
ncbi:hypothetical protein WMY93_022795 [Mugilogobius chulae]|uniref:Uncharacterized protein n=1 Tax=Mugilogobius chulae TaxID=88201 RepID=A0AAW0NB19_9GOBI